MLFNDIASISRTGESTLLEVVLCPASKCIARHQFAADPIMMGCVSHYDSIFRQYDGQPDLQ